VLGPPGWGEHTPQAGRIKMSENAVHDNELGQKDENIGKGGPEQDVHKSYRFGQIGKPEMCHGDRAEDYTEPGCEITGQGSFLEIQQPRGNQDIKKTKYERHIERALLRNGMDAEMEEPPSRG